MLGFFDPQIIDIAPERHTQPLIDGSREKARWNRYPVGKILYRYIRLKMVGLAGHDFPEPDEGFIKLLRAEASLSWQRFIFA